MQPQPEKRPVMQQPQAWSGPRQSLAPLPVPTSVQPTVKNTLPEPQPLSHSARRTEKLDANKLDEQLHRSSYVLL
jgi:hypothetical protein